VTDVLSAASNNGGALRYASEALRGDKKIEFAAVSNWGRALKLVPKNCNDREIAHGS
jgi:hypothetical protein